MPLGSIPPQPCAGAFFFCLSRTGKDKTLFLKDTKGTGLFLILFILSF